MISATAKLVTMLAFSAAVGLADEPAGKGRLLSTSDTRLLEETDCSDFCFVQNESCSGLDLMEDCGEDTEVGERCRGRNDNRQHTSFCETNNETPTCFRDNNQETPTRSVWRRIECVDCSEFCFEQLTDPSDCIGAVDLPNCGVGTNEGDKCRGRNSNRKNEPFCATNNENPTCTRPARPDGDPTISVFRRIACEVDCSQFCFVQKTDPSECTGAVDLPNCGEDTEVGDKCRGRNSNRQHEPFCATNNENPTCTRPNTRPGQRDPNMSVWERVVCEEDVW